MPPHAYMKAIAGGCTLDVDVSPGAERTEISRVNEWRNTLQIRVAAAPEQGKANEELRRFLSEKLSLQMSDVQVVKGARSRHKTIFIGISPEEFDRRMGVQ